MRLSKIADINNPESVKEALYNIELKPNSKANYTNVYTASKVSWQNMDCTKISVSATNTVYSIGNRNRSVNSWMRKTSINNPSNA